MKINYPHGLLFHHFTGNGHPSGQGAIDEAMFARILEYYGEQRILGSDEWLDRAEGGALQAEDLCITFDDGLLCQYEIALPVLEALGITAFWFIYTSAITGEGENGNGQLELYRLFRTTNFESIDEFYRSFDATLEKLALSVDVRLRLQGAELHAYLPHAPFYSFEDRRFRYIRDQILGPETYRAVMSNMMDEHRFDVSAALKHLWMSQEQISTLAQRGNCVGLHSHSHPTNLAAMSGAHQRVEYETNRDILRGIIGEDPEVMSHPCNSYTSETLSILNSMDIKFGFRADKRGPAKSVLEYPRLNHTLALNDMDVR